MERSSSRVSPTDFSLSASFLLVSPTFVPAVSPPIPSRTHAVRLSSSYTVRPRPSVSLSEPKVTIEFLCIRRLPAAPDVQTSPSRPPRRRLPLTCWIWPGECSANAKAPPSPLATKLTPSVSFFFFFFFFEFFFLRRDLEMMMMMMVVIIIDRSFSSFFGGWEAVTVRRRSIHS